MTLVVRRENPVVILDIGGRFTMGEAPLAMRKTVRALLNEGYKRFVFNLQQVNYLDSSGIGELVNCHALITSQGGRIRLVHAAGKIKNLLQVTKLVTVFETFADENKAIATLQ